MKEVTIILAVLLTACSQGDMPEPIDPTPNPTPNPTTTAIVPTITNPPIQVENFEGNWECINWVVDDMSGAERRRRIIFSNQDTTFTNISMNQYSSTGTLAQLFTMSVAALDSNYFINSINPVPIKFKGVMTTDSTLMVYEYQINSTVIDTIQVKEFKRI